MLTGGINTACLQFASIANSLHQSSGRMAVATGISEEVVALLTALLAKENRTVSLSIKNLCGLVASRGIVGLKGCVSEESAVLPIA